MSEAGKDSTNVHGSAVAIDGVAILIIGCAGSGKSTLALELMALGAVLVADDRTIVSREGDLLVALCPTPLAGMVEARFVGLLRTEPHGPAPIGLVVDLDQAETERLPPVRTWSAQGIAVPCIWGAHRPGLAAIASLYARHGRLA